MPPDALKQDLDAKGAYAVRQTCARTVKFTMYSTHVVSVCTFIHATPVLKFCTGMCPAVSCDFLAHPEILVSPHNRYNVAI